MRKGIHKNQIVIATLAVLIAIAGYISYDKTGFSFGDDSKQTSGKDDSGEWDELVYGDTEVGTPTDEKPNPGESVLTGTLINAADYAASVKLNREQIRAKNKETLLDIINNQNLTEEQKQDAVDSMVKMTDIAEKEADAEMLLEAKGFTNVVVSISEECVDVVLDMGEVTDAKRAQVEDVVKRKTGVSAEKIVITPINAGNNKEE